MRVRVKKSLLLSVLLLSGCAVHQKSNNPDHSQPSSMNNACAIMAEKPTWATALSEAERKYGVEPAQLLAMMYQESSFKYNARPIAKNGNGLRGTSFASSAYGFSQALELTWADYIKKSGHDGAKRESFADSAMFMAWFVDSSSKQTGIRKSRVDDMYLIYHEGAGGYAKKTFKDKSWLLDTANAVDKRYVKYKSQLEDCSVSELSSNFFARYFL